MKGRDPYHLALSALTGFAAGGRFGWGEPLVATALADELKLSPTPVREALARLAGEGLVEHRPGRGYFAPSPTAADIADLYAFHHRAVGWALDLADLGPDHLEAAAQTAEEGLFTEVVQAGRSAQLSRMHWRITLQLRPVRLIEHTLLPVSSTWLDAARARWRHRDLQNLRLLLDEYHDERSALGAQVVEVMRSPVKSIDQI